MECFSIFLIILLSLQPEGVRLLSSQVEVFSDNSTLKLEKLALSYESHPSIIVGAVNRLYQLTLDLKLKANITTGPFPTNSSFTKPDYNENVNPKSMDNYNKILLVYGFGDKSRLLTCGTLQFCSVYNLNGAIISESNVIKVFEPVVANTHTASTVAFIEHFLDKSRLLAGLGLGYALWTAQSGSNFTQPFEIPALAVRNLPSFKLSHNSSKILFNSESRNTYIVNYIYGFNSRHHEDNYKRYILTTQQSSATETSPYVSKLIRIYSGPEGNGLVNRYAEIPIECIVKGERPYNLVQAAYYLRRGDEGNTELLFAIFSQSENMNSQKPNNRSALCMYSREDIDKKFDENIKNCFQGNGNPGLEFISAGRQCIKHSIDEDSCPSGMNMPIGGNIPIKMFSLLTFDAHLTAIAARRLPEVFHYDVFVGTSSGHLKKIIVENSTSSCEYDDVTIDEQSSVNADLFFSSWYYLLVMTEHKLTKVHLEGVQFICYMFRTSDDCVKSKTTCKYWCSHTNECTTTKCGCNIRIRHWKLMYDSIKSETLSIIQPYDLEYLQHDISIAVKLRSNSGRFSNVLLRFKEFLRCRIAGEKFNITFIANVTVESGKEYTVDCSFPNSSSLAVPSGSHYLSLTLSILITNKNIPFVWSTNVSLHDCKAHTSCSKCIDSMSPCYWRMDKQKCMFKHTIKKHQKTGNHSNRLTNSCQHPEIPTISSFWPTKAPVGGRTMITIRGENLGYSFNDIVNPINVSGIPCTPIDDQFEPMKKVACFIETNQAITEGPIEMIANYVLVKSRENFTFVVPEIRLVSPLSGPVSGGTKITVEGENLDIGRLISVRIGKKPCLIFSLDTAKIECITSPCYNCNHALQDVIFTVDDVFYKYVNPFWYIDNYNDHDFYGLNLKTKSIPAGGIVIKTGFSKFPNTREEHYIRCGNSSFSGSCIILPVSRDTVCKSPYIPDIESESIDSKHPLSLNCLVMSIFHRGLQIIRNHEDVSISLYPNPKFHNFSTKFEEFTGIEFIIIKGNNIDTSCQKIDIHVNVGNCSCSMISLSLNEISPVIKDQFCPINGKNEYQTDLSQILFTVVPSTTFECRKPKKKSEDFDQTQHRLLY